MAQRFVIDININGAKGSAKSGSEKGSAMGGAAAGAVVGGPLTDGRQPGGISDEMIGDLDNYKGSEAYTKNRFSGLKEDFGLEAKAGRTARFFTRRKQNISEDTGGGQAYTETTVGKYTREHQKQVKALGIATAWQVANTAIDLKNYKSGDSYANQQRNNAMKMATFASVAAGTGFHPMVMTAMIGKELVSIYSDKQKYNFDRKLESLEIFNIKQIAGDVSYGINRRGGY